jgi:hypothetical protein
VCSCPNAYLITHALTLFQRNPSLRSDRLHPAKLSDSYPAFARQRLKCNSLAVFQPLCQGGRPSLSIAATIWSVMILRTSTIVLSHYSGSRHWDYRDTFAKAAPWSSAAGRYFADQAAKAAHKARFEALKSNQW